MACSFCHIPIFSPVHKYFLGEPLPAHLSPFVEDIRRTGDYIPPEEKQLPEDEEKQAESEDEDEEEEEEEEEEEGQGEGEEGSDDDEEESDEEEEDKMKVKLDEFTSRNINLRCLLTYHRV